MYRKLCFGLVAALLSSLLLGCFDGREPYQIQSANLCFAFTGRPGASPPGTDQGRHVESGGISRLG